MQGDFWHGKHIWSTYAAMTARPAPDCSTLLYGVSDFVVYFALECILWDGFLSLNSSSMVGEKTYVCSLSDIKLLYTLYCMYLRVKQIMTNLLAPLLRCGKVGFSLGLGLSWELLRYVTSYHASGWFFVKMLTVTRPEAWKYNNYIKMGSCEIISTLFDHFCAVESMLNRFFRKNCEILSIDGVSVDRPSGSYKNIRLCL